MPSPRNSTGSPPATTFTSTRPPENRSSVAVTRAANDGSVRPGRTAIRNRTRLVNPTSEDATTQESSHDRPVGISMP